MNEPVDFLLDTHVFLWWTVSSPRLHKDVAAAIHSCTGRISVSAVSVLELTMKRRFKKLDFPGSPHAAISENGFFEASVLAEDAELAGNLVWDHRDPFDRLLVAQAIRLRATLVTADAVLHETGVHSAALMWAS